MKKRIMLSLRRNDTGGVHWPNTWSRFEIAYQTYLTYHQRGIQGLEFVLTLDDPYVAIATLNSYTEVSPSGQGIRILLACPDFRHNLRRPQLELYSHARYVTIMGYHMAETLRQGEKARLLVPLGG